MADQRMKISFKQTFDILYPYAKSRVVDQVKGMALIIVYLVLFQTVVLGIGISQALTIALGLGWSSSVSPSSSKASFWASCRSGSSAGCACRKNSSSRSCSSSR
jgi:hypothetical protein